MNKSVHLAITVLLTSSIAGLHIADPDQPQTPVEQNKSSELPTFERIGLNQSTRTVNLDSLTTRQKAALMTVSYEPEQNISEDKIIGGIHLGSKPTKRDFIRDINSYKEGRPIKPFITADIEGCIEPTTTFRDFTSVHKINTSKQAYKLGKKQGRLMKEIDADINFAPVVDLKDTIWNCRSFKGSPEEIADKACSYIEGIQSQRIIATSKHYPGKTLAGKDPHNKIKHVSIEKNDLVPFKETIKCDTGAIMPSHQISTGEVNTQSKPADSSYHTVSNLRRKYNYTGLIVSDAISMGGIDHYYDSKKEKYIDLFRANDLILNLRGKPSDKAEMINIVAKGVKKNKLNQKYIDNSVVRILKAKGWTIR